MAEVMALKEVLKTRTMEGELYEKHPDGSLTCFACGHRCLIKEGRDGICRVRFNQNAMALPMEIRPLDFVVHGKRYRAKVIASSYNEPLITSEWAVKIFLEFEPVTLHPFFPTEINFS